MLSIREGEDKNFHDLVTGDESWFMFQYEHEVQWTVSRQNVASRVQPHFQGPKVMFTIVWGIVGFDVTALIISQRNFNGGYLVTEIMQPLVANFSEWENATSFSAYRES
jgi:hypothetical protein